VVTGLIAQYPLGGVSWDYVQYPLGLARLGHDVYYLEDTGQWPYDPRADAVATGCDYNVAYLAGVMERFGLRDRWAYRFAGADTWFGLPDRERSQVLATADVILDVSATLRRPQDLERRGVLALIDSDPVFTQLKLLRGQDDFRAIVDAHDVHFSFGEVVERALPSTGHRWLPTRQPIVLDEWIHDLPDRGRYTTVMNWSSYNDVEFEGRRYGQKDLELQRFLDLPAHSPVPLEIAMASGKNARAPKDLLRHRGWRIVDPASVCADVDGYRDYVQRSRGEWSVAKHGYVAGRAGWFSCRSACYLAAGRPAVVQDTGFSEVLPSGEGVLTFDDPDGAAAALAEVEADYDRHAEAAAAFARQHFDSAVVLARLLEDATATSASSAPARA
jgi:hypothetical protein